MAGAWSLGAAGLHAVLGSAINVVVSQPQGDEGWRPWSLRLVIEVLSRLVSDRRAPAALRSDNGPEFVAEVSLRQPCLARRL
jgi:hypothetical protein